MADALAHENGAGKALLLEPCCAHAKQSGCNFFAYSWILLTVEFLLAVAFWSVSAYSWSFLAYSWSLLACSAKVLRISTSTDCKQKKLNCK